MAYSSIEIDKAAAAKVGDSTLLQYLRRLLRMLWREAELFSGKRPFGDGSWQYDVYKGLIEAGLVKGRLDADGCVEDVDDRAADALVLAVIERLRV